VRIFREGCSKSSFIATALVVRRQKINPDIRAVAVTPPGRGGKAAAGE
jgi:hypothetical protein